MNHPEKFQYRTEIIRKFIKESKLANYLQNQRNESAKESLAVNIAIVLLVTDPHRTFKKQALEEFIKLCERVILLEKSGKYNPPPPASLESFGCNRLTVERCDIAYSKGGISYSANTDGVNISDIHIENCDEGIIVSDPVYGIRKGMCALAQLKPDTPMKIMISLVQRIIKEEKKLK